MRTRTFLLVGLLAAVLLAGVASYWASSHPDGLARVAEKTGFADSQRDSATADGPFARYETRGVDDDRLSRGIAGVAGVLLVGVLGTGLFWVVRRRDDHGEPSEQHEQQDA